MTDAQLNRTSPLQGKQIERGGTSLGEFVCPGMTSIAIPLGAAPALDLPDVGQTTLTPDGGRLVRLSIDQLFYLGDDANTPSIDGYRTDQTDGWAFIRLQGPLAVAALERICMLDLHPASFTTGRAARTMMEHLNVIIIKETDDQFLLLSARSSAGSFWHALEVSLTNVA